MALPLKIAGLRELRALATRNARQLAMGRIAQTDHDYIKLRLDEIEARIIRMREEVEEDGD